VKLIRVPVSDLREGQYVHSLCGSWLNHDFWRTAFKIDGPDTLRRLRESQVTEVMVDLDRCDAPAAAAPGHHPDAPVPASAAEAVAQDPGDVAVTDRPAAAAGACATRPGARAAAPARAAPSARTDPAPSTGAPAAGAQPAAPAGARRRDPRLPEPGGYERARVAVDRAHAAVGSIFSEAGRSGRVDRDTVRGAAALLRSAIDRDPGAMLTLVRLKTVDQYTTMHSIAVGTLMHRLGVTLGLDADHLERCLASGLLHDIGKLAVPVEVLMKPSKLSPEEFDMIRRHPEAGHRILREAGGVDQTTLDVCRHHHERIDGSGYPDRLSGDAVSMFARMGAICDVYDAVTSDRPYKKGWAPAEAMRRMAAMRAGHFDETLFRAFVRLIGAWPTGSLVRLRSQRLAVVIAQHETNLRTPLVRAVYSIPMQTPIDPRTIDLSDGRDAIVAEEKLSDWGLPPLEVLMAGA
jgi:HD-GYP domain-containing protein (c-di-GMP phosphodiesterase class II)